MIATKCIHHGLVDGDGLKSINISLDIILAFLKTIFFNSNAFQLILGKTDEESNT